GRRPAKLRPSDLLHQSEGEPGSGFGGEDEPGLFLAARMAASPRLRVVRVDLNGKGLRGEEIFDEQPVRHADRREDRLADPGSRSGGAPRREVFPAPDLLEKSGGPPGRRPPP